MLQRFGYRCSPTESGVEALKVWEKNRDRIELLLTDIVMPDGMTGYELARQLLTDKPELKVIYTSGYSADLGGRHSLLVEGVNFLQKPYAPQALAEILRKSLDAAADQKQRQFNFPGWSGPGCDPEASEALEMKLRTQHVVRAGRVVLLVVAQGLADWLAWRVPASKAARFVAWMWAGLAVTLLAVLRRLLAGPSFARRWSIWPGPPGKSPPAAARNGSRSPCTAELQDLTATFNQSAGRIAGGRPNPQAIGRIPAVPPPGTGAVTSTAPAAALEAEQRARAPAGTAP